MGGGIKLGGGMKGKLGGLGIKKFSSPTKAAASAGSTVSKPKDDEKAKDTESPDKEQNETAAESAEKPSPSSATKPIIGIKRKIGGGISGLGGGGMKGLGGGLNSAQKKKLFE